MELEEIISSIKNLDFDDVIKRESLVYLTNAHRFVAYQDKDDDKKYITNGLKRFINKSDKIIFLLEAINYLNKELVEINESIDYKLPKDCDYVTSSIYERDMYLGNKELKERKTRIENQVFYAVRELEKLGLNGLDKNAFSNSQISDLTRKIDALLIKIDELTVGQEVIYNFVDDLKTDLKELKSEFPLGKKRWYQRLSGIVTSYLGNKGADALYGLLKPDIIKIIKEIAINNLLH